MQYQTDVLVIGSGIAGLTFAIHAAKFANVLVVTKKNDSESNTNYAQGGVACVLDPTDSFAAHIQDTQTAGAGLCDRRSVEILVEEGPERIAELMEWGAAFTRSPESQAAYGLELGREGGHTANRIVHARDLTGREIERAILSKVRSLANVTILEDHDLVELVTDHHVGGAAASTCYGAYIFDNHSRRVDTVAAKITMLATGGAGVVYRHTSNPAIATGDGLAAAWRSGAEVRNMEFIQFHPTTLFVEGADRFLITEALRGYGAVLRDASGADFMAKYHEMKSLAPRDIVARAIDNEMKISGAPCVFLDITHADAEETKKRFPNVYAKCLTFGIDITKQLIPVVPAAHYCCGGVAVDTQSNTTIANLYASGEVACTGIHGANRLASNSLLEALVFSHRASVDASQKITGVANASTTNIPAWDDSGTIDTEEWVLISHNLEEIRAIMWDYVGIVRSDLRLARAMRRIELLEHETEDFYRRTRITQKLLELRNIITVAKLIVQSAQMRHESRGLHYTTDHPTPCAEHLHDTVLSRA